MAIRLADAARDLLDPQVAPVPASVLSVPRTAKPAPAAIATVPQPCLIINTRSYRAAGGLGARAAATAAAHGADVIEADGLPQVLDGLDRCLARGQYRIVLLAGDGTVQGVVTHLSSRAGSAALPEFAILGGGRTNLTAVDLGGHGAVLQGLEAALRRWESGDAPLELRPTLVVEQPPAPPRHGFFIAGAYIDRIIRYAHRGRQKTGSWLNTGRLSTVWMLAQLGVLSSLRRRPLGEADDLGIHAEGCGDLHGPMRVLIASTLLHRQGAFNPYAAAGHGALRITAVAMAAPFWRRLPRILTGRFSSRMGVGQGYLSGRCERIEVSGLAAYSLDGETFDTDPLRPVVIRPGLQLAFLRP